MLRHDFGNPLQGRGIDPVGFVQHDHVGALDLLLEQFLQRAFMIERIGIGSRAACTASRSPCETACRDGLGIDHGDDAVHRDAGANFRPCEGFDQRLGQRQPDVSITI